MATFPQKYRARQDILKQSLNDTSPLGKKKTELIRWIQNSRIDSLEYLSIRSTYLTKPFTATHDYTYCEEYILAGLADDLIERIDTVIKPDFISYFNSPTITVAGLEQFIDAHPILSLDFIMNEQLQYTPLMDAIYNDRKDIVKVLLHKGADANYIPAEKNAADGVLLPFPLYIAIKACNYDMVHILLHEGDTDPNIYVRKKEGVAIQTAIRVYHTINVGIGFGPEDHANSRKIIEELLGAYAEISSHTLMVAIDNIYDGPVFASILDAFLGHSDGVINDDSEDELSFIEYALMVGKSYNNIECIKLLLSVEDFDFNTKGRDNGNSLMFIGAENDNLEFVKELIVTYNQPIDEPLKEAVRAKSFTPRIQTYLETHLHTPGGNWKGFTQSDMTKLNTIFDDNQRIANDYALCPVCLQYVVRSDGCMYMKHNCSDTGSLYHHTLYTMYKNDEGLVAWCTICGRISAGHRHYELGAATSSVKLPLRKETSGDPFATSCRQGHGGGGLDEKMMRFRRYRQYALALQRKIGSIKEQDAWNTLVEQTWNAPLQLYEEEINAIKTAKKFGNNTNFPANSTVVEEEDTRVYPDMPLVKPLPTLSEGPYPGYPGNVSLITFHHQPDHTIPVEEVVDYIEEMAPSFAHEHFGDCIAWGDGCGEDIHPLEIKDIVPADVYEVYRKNFNKKFAALSSALIDAAAAGHVIGAAGHIIDAPAPAAAFNGAIAPIAPAGPLVAVENVAAPAPAQGGRRKTRKLRKLQGGAERKSMIVEATNAVCIPPWKQEGGRRTRRKNSKNLRKTNAKSKKSRRT